MTATSQKERGATGGRIADNIVYFARALRKAGLPVGPAAVVDAIQAVETGGLGSREDFFWTLHAVFVTRREQHPVFREAFDLFWRERGLIEKLLEILSPAVAGPRKEEALRAGRSRAEDALSPRDRSEEPEATPQLEVDARLTMSEREILQTKDFAQMSAEEIAEAIRLVSGLRLPYDRVPLRRLKPAAKGLFDPRRTMSASLRTGGDIVMPRFRRPAEIHPPVVALCDISGSMSQYTRVFLHFLHALTENRRVHSFLFGTRLTNVTRDLQRRDPDEALLRCAASVIDWSGGTRIAETLAAFNRDWSRRVLGQGAIVLLITDGLERPSGESGGPELAFEMDRLHRSCRRLVWLNPLLRFTGFEAKAQGIRAMLPHVDEFRPIHNFDSLAGLVEALARPMPPAHDPGLLLEAV